MKRMRKRMERRMKGPRMESQTARKSSRDTGSGIVVVDGVCV